MGRVLVVARASLRVAATLVEELMQHFASFAYRHDDDYVVARPEKGSRLCGDWYRGEFKAALKEAARACSCSCEVKRSVRAAEKSCSPVAAGGAPDRGVPEAGSALCCGESHAEHDQHCSGDAFHYPSDARAAQHVPSLRDEQRSRPSTRASSDRTRDPGRVARGPQRCLRERWQPGVVS